MRGGGLGRKKRGRGGLPADDRPSRLMAKVHPWVGAFVAIIDCTTPTTFSAPRVEWRRDGGLLVRGAAGGGLTGPGSAFHSTGPLIADISPLLTDIPGPT